MSIRKFPLPIQVNGRGFYDRWEIERYKLELLGRAVAPRDPNDPIELVASAKVLAELGISKRTLLRRVAESQAA